jgi:hypothetical protein
MKSLIGVMQVISVSGPHPIVKAELQVSSTDDLPELYELVDGVIVGPGSISQLIEDGGFVTIDEDGDWKPSGSTPDAAASSLSMSAPKNLGRIRDEQPIEEIEEITEEPAVKEQKKVFEESIEEPEEKDGEDDDELL